MRLSGRYECSSKASDLRWFTLPANSTAQLPRLLDQLDAGDVLMVTRLDRLGRSTRDALNTFAAITSEKGGFRSLGDAWADTTTAHGRLMVTVLGEPAVFEGFDPHTHH